LDGELAFVLREDGALLRLRSESQGTHGCKTHGENGQSDFRFKRIAHYGNDSLQ